MQALVMQLEDKEKETIRTSTTKAWIPPSAIKRRDAATSHTPQSQTSNNNIDEENTLRKIREILNKLTPEKFDKLLNEFYNLQIKSVKLLKGLILLILDKALCEPNYSALYAQLCQRLDKIVPNFEPYQPVDITKTTTQITTFRKLLLTICQHEFDNRNKLYFEYRIDKPTPLHSPPSMSNTNGNDDDGDDDDDDKLLFIKKKIFGNCKFICELSQLDMLNEAIVHKCIKTLLEKSKQKSYDQMSLDLECICKMMPCIGAKLDQGEAVKLMDQYFERITKLKENKQIQLRIRCLLMDLIDLRENKWKTRRVNAEQEPKTIKEFRSLSLGSTQSTKSMNYDNNGGCDDDNENNGHHYNQHYKAHHHHQNMNYNNNGHYHHTHHHQQQQQQQYRNSQQNIGIRQYGVIQSNGGFSAVLTDREEMDIKPIIPLKLTQQQQQSGNGMRKAQQFVKQNGNNSTLIVMPVSLPPSPPPPPSSLVVLQPKTTDHHHQFQQPSKKHVVKGQTATVGRKEELYKRFECLLNEYLLNKLGIDQLMDGLKQQTTQLKSNGSHSQLNEFIQFIIIDSLSNNNNGDKEYEERFKLKCCLLLHIHKQLSSTSDGLLLFTNAFNCLLDKINDFEQQTYFYNVKSCISKYCAYFICNDLLTLSYLANQMKYGLYYPLFFLCLQNIHQQQKHSTGLDDNWLLTHLERQNINLIDMLPTGDRSKERLIQILEDRQLDYLYPIHKIETRLFDFIVSTSSSSLATCENDLKEFILNNFNQHTRTSTTFLHALLTCIIKYAAEQTLLSDNNNSSSQKDSSKSQLKQKQLIEQYKNLLGDYLNNQRRNQIEALYAIQVYAEIKQFPKYFLPILFHQMYDLELIDEEAFYEWKDEINEHYPNKGKALFHLQKFFNWLQEASEESS